MAALLSGAAEAQFPSEPLLTVFVTAGTEPLAGAQVRVGSARGRTDASGRVTLRVDTGRVVVHVTRLGYRPRSDTVLVSLIPITVRVDLEPLEESLERVVVSTTRTERQVEQEPVRVEVVDRDEVDEKAAMTPGDVAMLLNETSGVRVQTTSPALGGANVRVLGLRGRYTQVLADGLPLFGGSLGGLGLLQIPPLDLERVEIIKGAASAFYGASALGGVVNLISRAPAAERDWSLLVNATSRGGTDLVGWTSGPIGASWRQSLLVGNHTQRLHDANDDRWADLARFERIVIRPRLHYDNEDGQTFYFTAGLTDEDRRGGETIASTPGAARYMEGLTTRRTDAGAIGRILAGDGMLYVARAATSGQCHTHRFGDAHEHDCHDASMLEVSATGQTTATAWVLGAAWQRDAYEGREVRDLDYTFTVPGLFAQVERELAGSIALSASARYDRHSRYGSSLSPRLSALIRLPYDWTLRAALGSGNYSPIPFVEETDGIALRGLDPASFASLRAERSTSATLDASGSLGAWRINASLYETRIRHAVLWRELEASPTYSGALVNAAQPTVTRGLETNVRYHRGPLILVGSYVVLRAREDDVHASDGVRVEVPLTPHHAAGLDAMWEMEGKGRIGVEWYYVGRQILERNPYRRVSRPYGLYGVLLERQWGRARIFLNSENLGDVRQTRFDPMLRPAPDRSGRRTVDAWAPLEGRVFNAGARFLVR